MADEVGMIESSLCSGGESGFLGELVEGVLVVAGGGAQPGRLRRVGIGECGEAGLEQSGMDVGEQHRLVDTGVVTR